MLVVQFGCTIMAGNVNIPGEPMQSEECGHRFCKTCAANLAKSLNGKKYICPQDRMEVHLFQDRGKEREILGRLIKCTNNKSGCATNIELRYLDVHLKTCEFQIVKCLFSDCEEKVQRKLLEKHSLEDCEYRLKSCIFCFEDYSFNMEKEHMCDCSSFPLCCDYCTEIDIPRNQMQCHVTEKCVKVPTPCEFAPLGCQKQTTIASKESHRIEATQHHLALALNKLIEQQDELKQKSDQLFSLRSDHERLKSKLDAQPSISQFKDEHIFHLDNFAKLFEEAETGEAFTLHMYTSQLHKITISIYFKGYTQDCKDNVSVFFQCTQGSFDDVAKWPMGGNIDLCVIYVDEEYWNLKLSGESLLSNAFKNPKLNTAGQRRGWLKVISQNRLVSYVDNDCLCLKIKVNYK
ncbi:TNF receptor-associated factor 6-like isoform X2 [Clytia hemisphaerica]|uniref:TNF receptor-associated factor 6-like isoform X2 n=1 Tax=Clytia hemisphaerica TaxID=252671 RepID=UPI0034D4C497